MVSSEEERTVMTYVCCDRISSSPVCALSLTHTHTHTVTHSSSYGDRIYATHQRLTEDHILRTHLEHTYNTLHTLRKHS